MQAVADAASQITVTVPAQDAGQLVMGLTMAVGQIVREIYGELPTAAGEPLDALCELLPGADPAAPGLQAVEGGLGPSPPRPMHPSGS